MLTIIGAKGGLDTFWCVLPIPKFIGTGIGPDISGFLVPISMHLPPNDGNWYRVSPDGFGIAAQYEHIGHLDYPRLGSKDIPKPCDHLDAQAILAYSEGNLPSLHNGVWNPLATGVRAYLQHSETGPTVSSYSGWITHRGRGYAYRRDGTTFVPSSGIYGSRVPSGWPTGGSPPAGQVPYRFGQYLYITQPMFSIKGKWLEYMVKPTIEKYDTIKVTGIYNSLMPATVVPLQGGWESFDATQVITHLRGNTNGSFHALVSVKSVKKRYVIDAYGRRTDSPDVVVNTVNSVIDVAIMSASAVPESGPITVQSIVKELDQELTEYGDVSKRRVKDVLMREARSLAIADIDALESNNLENVSGLKGSFSIINDLLAGYKALNTGDIATAAKALSGCYLWYKYACAPTLRDIEDVKKNTSRLVSSVNQHKFSNERRRGRVEDSFSPIVGDSNYFVTYHTRLKDNVYSDLWNRLEKFGIEPTVAQAWDLIPFSFVVDWFVKAGPTLRRLDDYNSFVMHRDITWRIETYKTKLIVRELPIWSSSITLMGDYEKSYYHRVVFSGSVGDVNLLAAQDHVGNRSSQMVQGLALLVQQLD